MRAPPRLRRPRARLQKTSRGSVHTCQWFPVGTRRWVNGGEGGRGRGAEGWATYEIIAQQLHDERGILITLLRQGVKLGNRLIKARLGHLTRFIGRIQNLIVKHGEVQREPQANGMRGCEIRSRDLGSRLVSFERFIRTPLPLITRSKLGEVTVIIALHLVVEDLALAALGRGDEVLIEDGKDVFADVGKLGFNFLAVGLDQRDLGFVAFGLFFLLDRRNDAPRSAARADHVFVRHREEVTFFDGEFLVG